MVLSDFNNKILIVKLEFSCKTHKQKITLVNSVFLIFRDCERCFARGGLKKGAKNLVILHISAITQSCEVGV